MFFEDNLNYIDKCAAIHAHEIDRITGRQDYEDTKQELLLYVWRYSDRFDARKSSVQTFVSHYIREKRRCILRHYRAKKTIMQTQSIPLNHA